VFWVISVYFSLRNIIPKSGTFPPGHPIYIYIYYSCTIQRRDTLDGTFRCSIIQRGAQFDTLDCYCFRWLSSAPVMQGLLFELFTVRGAFFFCQGKVSCSLQNIHQRKQDVLYCSYNVTLRCVGVSRVRCVKQCYYIF